VGPAARSHDALDEPVVQIAHRSGIDGHGRGEGAAPQVDLDRAGSARLARPLDDDRVEPQAGGLGDGRRDGVTTRLGRVRPCAVLALGGPEPVDPPDLASRSTRRRHLGQ